MNKLIMAGRVWTDVDLHQPCIRGGEKQRESFLLCIITH